MGPFTGVPWPPPGAGGGPGPWVTGSAARGRRARVYACEAGQLSRWLGPELWLVELDGDVERGAVKCSARRARLCDRVRAWDAPAAAALAAHCAVFAAGRRPGDPALAAYVASIEEEAGLAAAAAVAGDPAEASARAAAAAHQAAWAARQVGGEEAFAAAHAGFCEHLRAALALPV